MKIVGAFLLIYLASIPCMGELVQVGLTDKNIKYKPERFHYVRGCGAGPDCPKTLFVFLPGTGGEALNHKVIVDSMYELGGVAALSLSYEAPNEIKDLCGNDDACYDRARRARVLGDNLSWYVSSKSDGIKNRLEKLLRYLGWTNFYTERGLRSEVMVIGGSSQGAGMAAWIGKHARVKRICQLGGTWDHVIGASGYQAASWLSAPSVTPSSEFYGFANKNDSANNGIFFLNLNWTALGMGSQSVPLPLWSNPSGQKIETEDADQGCAVNEHRCVSSDGFTPMDNGLPRYRFVWKYVCGL